MEFLKFVNESPTPYHAVASAIKLLKAHGYKAVSEKETWNLEASGKYYVTRNASSIIAFALGPNWKSGDPVGIVGAHTDSPTLRIKPKSHIEQNGYVELGVELYGGGLWPTWFDRDLSVAGRVYVRNGSRSEVRLIKVDKPLLRIPTIAIHLHREQSAKLEFNKEEHLRPILGLVPESVEADKGEHPSGLMAVIAKEAGVSDVKDVEDFELVLYDTQLAQIGGINDEFLFSPRLDNLNSCFTALHGLVNSSDSAPGMRMIALFDHEEVGSTSAQGAASNFLGSVLGRLSSDHHDMAACLAKSFLISADMAHAVHPNYASKHERMHQPAINAGPVIKTNANQRYATNSFGVVLLQRAAEKAGVPLQKFVVRNDSTCGSTIGPIMAANIGVRTIDIGNPQLSMHSIREMGGVADLEYATELFKAFFDNYVSLENEIELE